MNVKLGVSLAVNVILIAILTASTGALSNNAPAVTFYTEGISFQIYTGNDPHLVAVLKNLQTQLPEWYYAKWAHEYYLVKAESENDTGRIAYEKRWIRNYENLIGNLTTVNAHEG